MTEIGVRQLASLQYQLPLSVIFYVKHPVVVYSHIKGNKYLHVFTLCIEIYCYKLDQIKVHTKMF